MTTYLEDNVSNKISLNKCFILARETSTSTPVEINNQPYLVVGRPFDNHLHPMVATVIEEDGYLVELVLHKLGLVMITKANGNEVKMNTREYSSPWYQASVPSRQYPKRYNDIVDGLKAAYDEIFKNE